MVEHLTFNQRVEGSSPLAGTIFMDVQAYHFDFKQQNIYEPLAQLVEHLTFNQRVEGSSPSWLTSFMLTNILKVI